MKRGKWTQRWKASFFPNKTHSIANQLSIIFFSLKPCLNLFSPSARSLSGWNVTTKNGLTSAYLTTDFDEGKNQQRNSMDTRTKNKMRNSSSRLVTCQVNPSIEFDRTKTAEIFSETRTKKVAIKFQPKKRCQLNRQPEKEPRNESCGVWFRS